MCFKASIKSPSSLTFAKHFSFPKVIFHKVNSIKSAIVSIKIKRKCNRNETVFFGTVGAHLFLEHTKALIIFVVFDIYPKNRVNLVGLQWINTANKNNNKHLQKMRHEKLLIFMLLLFLCFLGAVKSVTTLRLILINSLEQMNKHQLDTSKLHFNLWFKRRKVRSKK